MTYDDLKPGDEVTLTVPVSIDYATQFDAGERLVVVNNHRDGSITLTTLLAWMENLSFPRATIETRYIDPNSLQPRP